MTKKTKQILITSIICVAILTIVSVIIIHFTYYKFSFITAEGKTLSNKSHIEIGIGSSEIPKVSAIYKDYTSSKNGAACEVSMKGTVDLAHLGEYVVTYTATYQDKSKSIDVTIKVVDNDAPVISLNGGSEIYWALGKEFTDPGFSAFDNVDGDITSKVETVSTVDINKEGTYTITYKVTDSSKREAVVTRTVNIKNIDEQQVINPGDKVVYLTFDDGPGPYTQKLLDILDRYGVKVTFFTTDAYPGHEDLLTEEARRGHTVAIHTFSHRYNDIYASDDAFFTDLYAMSDLIKSKTGQTPRIIRFPGGSSNTISAKYSPGMMTRLTQEVTARGFLYADWNVASGDAGETSSTGQIVANVIDGISKHNVSTVLQHDVKEFSVDAVPRIIEWGQANGYKFLPLTENSPMEHHSILN